MKTKAGSLNSDLGLRDRGPKVTAEPIIEGKKLEDGGELHDHEEPKIIWTGEP
jgi:hypothetical protein